MSEKSPQGAASAPGVRFPLWMKLLWMTTALAVLPTTAMGLALLNYKTASIKSSIERRQDGVSDELSRLIDQSLLEAQSGLEAMSLVLTRPGLDPDARVAMVLLVLSATAELDHATFYDAKGEVIDTARQEGAEKLKDRALPAGMLKEAREAAEVELVKEPSERRWVPIVGKVEEFEGGPRAPMVSPIISREDKLTGFVGSYLSLAPIQARIEEIQQDHYPGDPDAVFVVDDAQRIIAHPDPALSRHLAPLKDEVLSANAKASSEVARGEAGGAGTLEDFRDGQGREMVGRTLPLRYAPWVMVTKEPVEAAYAEIWHTRKVLIGTLIGAVLLSLIVSLIFVRSLARPIRQLVAFAQDLSERRFDAKVSIGTRDELALLGGVMVEAAGKLKASEEKIREEEAIRTDLGRYLPREIVERVVRREQEMSLGGQRREVTVLFADVVGFTSMAEELGAEEVVGLLNELFTILTEIVFRHGGTVDKFIGDCVMAFWGAPDAQEDHAERALSAAEDMMRFLEVGNAGWAQKYGVKVELAIGINSGEVVVGNVGSETRMEYTVIGDVVNTAARLEAIARPQQILVTEATREGAGDLFEYIPFGSRKLSSGDRETSVYEVEV